PTAAPRWGALGLSAAAALTSAALLYQMNQEVRARDEAGRLAVWDEHDAAARRFAWGGWIAGGLSLAALGWGLWVPPADAQAGVMLLRF
ncbi:hypothetical protein KKF91_08385, partial [Myxococcota bacterium]|nr:hypothetical protein [Myxococcota bacterium]